jgi:hypothetical protein
VVSVARQLAVAAIALAFTELARAESDKERARDLFQEGVSLAKDERWTEALSRFEESRALFERPSTVFNIGTTLMRLERHKAAIAAFEQFLTLTDSPEQRSAAEELMRQSKESLASVQLTIEPHGATLVIDGETLPANGPTRHLQLDPGERIMEVSATGFDSLREALDLEPGAKLVRTIALSPVAPPSVAPPPPPTAPQMTPVAETKVEEESILASPWFWVVAGAVVVGAAVGIGVGVGTRRVADPSGGTAMDTIEP